MQSLANQFKPKFDWNLLKHNISNVQTETFYCFFFLQRYLCSFSIWWQQHISEKLGQGAFCVFLQLKCLGTEETSCFSFESELFLPSFLLDIGFQVSPLLYFFLHNVPNVFKGGGRSGLQTGQFITWTLLFCSNMCRLWFGSVLLK